MIVCGIDASLTGTAVAIGDGATHVVDRFPSPASGKQPAQRVQRIDSIVSRAMNMIESHAPKPSLILIEGYAFGAAQGREELGELGGILRWHLVDVCQVIEVAPSTLKKFVCGSGNAKKDQMQAHIVKRWGEIFPTNDHADAFALYQMALVTAGITAGTAADRETIKKLDYVRSK